MRTVCLCGLFIVHAFGNDELEWMSFPKGFAKAQTEQKYIFINFSAKWCTYCKLFENTTLTHPDVIKELSTNFISIKVDTDSQEKIMWDNQQVTLKDFSAQMGVSELPALVFLNKDGDLIGHHPGFADEQTTLAMLKYISSGARERNISFMEFQNTPAQ